jgi:hypothetical protein
VLIAKAIASTPVQAIWSREDVVMGDKVRPMMAQQITLVWIAKAV